MSSWEDKSKVRGMIRPPADVPKIHSRVIGGQGPQQPQVYSRTISDTVGITAQDADEAASASPAQPPTSPGVLKPLTVKEQAVLNLIKVQPKGSGITGRRILEELDTQKIYLAQSTLTRHIIPKLKEWYGVLNRKGAGYYIQST